MLVSVTIAILSMWLMWSSVYLHQMHPIIKPLLKIETEA